MCVCMFLAYIAAYTQTLWYKLKTQTLVHQPTLSPSAMAVPGPEPVELFFRANDPKLRVYRVLGS